MVLSGCARRARERAGRRRRRQGSRAAGRARSRGRRPRVSRRSRRRERWRSGPRWRRWRRRQLATGRVRRGRGPRRALRPQVSGRPGGRSRPGPGEGRRVPSRSRGAFVSASPGGPSRERRRGEAEGGRAAGATVRALAQSLLCGPVYGQHGGGQPRAARAAVGPCLGGSGRAASPGPVPLLCGGERSLLPCLCRHEQARGRPPGPLQPLSLSLAPPSFLCGIVRGPSSTLPDAT